MAKNAKPVNSADLANSKLVTQAVAIGTKNITAEFALLEPFAKLLKSGKLSVRGVQETIKRIESELSANGESVKMATLRGGHAQYLVNAWELSKVPNAPKNIAELCTLAKHARSWAKLPEADTKAEAVNTLGVMSVEQGIGYAELRKAVPTLAGTPKGERNRGTKSLELSAKAIEEFADTLVTISKTAEIADDEILDALSQLRAVLETILD